MKQESKSVLYPADNDAKFFDVSSGTPVNDVNKTNHFFYKENNNAGYSISVRNLKNSICRLVLRGEQTNIETQQINRKYKI